MEKRRKDVAGDRMDSDPERATIRHKAIRTCGACMEQRLVRRRRACGVYADDPAGSSEADCLGNDDAIGCRFDLYTKRVP